MTPLPVTPEPLAPAWEECTPASGIDPEGDLDRRWVAWLVEGHAKDVRMRRRMTWVAWLAGAGIVSWPAWGPVLLNVIVPGRS